MEFSVCTVSGAATKEQIDAATGQNEKAFVPTFAPAATAGPAMLSVETGGAALYGAAVENIGRVPGILKSAYDPGESKPFQGVPRLRSHEGFGTERGATSATSCLEGGDRRVDKVASLRGLEPPTSWFVATRSIQLSYRLAVKFWRLPL